MTKSFYVYILANKSNAVLYTGVTNNLVTRIYQHKNKLLEGFTKKYNVNKLLFYEEFPTALEAIAAEKKIKGWLRKRKIELIKIKNPQFEDLAKFL